MNALLEKTTLAIFVARCLIKLVNTLELNCV